MNTQVCFRVVTKHETDRQYIDRTKHPHVVVNEVCTKDLIVSFPSNRFPLSLVYCEYLNSAQFVPKEVVNLIIEYTFKIPFEIYWFFGTNGAKLFSIKHITLKEHNDLVLLPNTVKCRSQRLEYFEVSRKYINDTNNVKFAKSL